MGLIGGMIGFVVGAILRAVPAVANKLVPKAVYVVNFVVNMIIMTTSYRLDTHSPAIMQNGMFSFLAPIAKVLEDAVIAAVVAAVQLALQRLVHEYGVKPVLYPQSKPKM